MTRDMATRTIIINQSTFIKDLVIKKNLTDSNANVIPMKARSAIKMFEPDNYNKTDLHMYL